MYPLLMIFGFWLHFVLDRLLSRLLSDVCSTGIFHRRIVW
jgi:hypothetical protein